MSTPTPSPRYFLATDADDGSGSMALWRNRPGDPTRPDPVLYQHSADPGVWDAAVAKLVRGDADTPLAERLQEIADQVPPCLPEPVAAQLARHFKAAGQMLAEIEWMRAGTPGGGERG